MDKVHRAAVVCLIGIVLSAVTCGCGGGGVALGTIGPNGGTVTINGIVIIVPPGALTETITIRATILTGAQIPGNIPGGLDAAIAVRFGPEGQLFLKQVDVVFPINPALAGAEAPLLSFNEATRVYDRLSKVTLANGGTTAAGKIDHFSVWLIPAADALPAIPDINVVNFAQTPDTDMRIGDAALYIPRARDSANQIVNGVKFVWLSSDTTIVRVSNSGVVKALGVGSADVTVRAADVNGPTHEATAHVRVRPEVPELAYHDTGSGQFLITDLNGQRIATLDLPANLEDVQNPAFARDGQALLFQARLLNETITHIFRITRAEPPQVTQLTNDLVSDESPRPSFDGTKICFVRFSSGRSRSTIQTMNTDGTNILPVTDVPDGTFDSAPAFTPDDSQIVFSRRIVPAFAEQIFIVNAAAGIPFNLSNNLFFDLTPVVSPANRIAFSSNREPSANVGRSVYTMTIAGFDVLRVSQRESSEPDWSGDGNLLCFSAMVGNNSAILVTDPTGQNERQIDTRLNRLAHPTFNPAT